MLWVARVALGPQVMRSSAPRAVRFPEPYAQLEIVVSPCSDGGLEPGSKPREKLQQSREHPRAQCCCMRHAKSISWADYRSGDDGRSDKADASSGGFHKIHRSIKDFHLYRNGRAVAVRNASELARSRRATARNAEALLARVCRLREVRAIIPDGWMRRVDTGGVLLISAELRGRAGNDNRDPRVGVADPIIRIVGDDIVQSTCEVLCAGQFVAGFFGVSLVAARFERVFTGAEFAICICGALHDAHGIVAGQGNPYRVETRNLDRYRYCTLRRAPEPRIRNVA